MAYWVWQWSAVMDKRTCSVCRPLHGKMGTGPDAFGGHRPPVHPRCRCVLVLSRSDFDAPPPARRHQAAQGLGYVEAELGKSARGALDAAERAAGGRVPGLRGLRVRLEAALTDALHGGRRWSRDWGRTVLLREAKVLDRGTAGIDLRAPARPGDRAAARRAARRLTGLWWLLVVAYVASRDPDEQQAAARDEWRRLDPRVRAAAGDNGAEAYGDERARAVRELPAPGKARP